MPKLYQDLHGSPTTHRNYKGYRETLLLLLLLSSSSPLLPCNRVVRKTHTSPIVARNLLCPAMGETNTVRVTIHLGPTSRHGARGVGCLRARHKHAYLWPSSRRVAPVHRRIPPPPKRAFRKKSALARGNIDLLRKNNGSFSEQFL